MLDICFNTWYGKHRDSNVKIWLTLILLFSLCEVTQQNINNVNVNGNGNANNGINNIQQSDFIVDQKTQLKQQQHETKQREIKDGDIAGSKNDPILHQNIPEINDIDSGKSVLHGDKIQGTAETKEEQKDTPEKVEPPVNIREKQSTKVHSNSLPCFPQDAPNFHPNTGGAARPGGLGSQALDNHLSESLNGESDSIVDVPCEGRQDIDMTHESKGTQLKTQAEEPALESPQMDYSGVPLTEHVTPLPEIDQKIPTPITEPPLDEPDQVKEFSKEPGQEAAQLVENESIQKQGKQEQNTDSTKQEQDQDLGDPDEIQDQKPEDGELKPDDSKDKPVKVEDLEMPSFDEWKQKMLAEQEKTKQTAQSSETPGSPVVNKVKPLKKNRLNTASQTCGAKVLAANTEAQNPASVLTENRDQYLINPCKAKKWFVIELCEPVKVQSIEIANFEMFSSTPEKFVVQICDRYPTKEWTALGTFHARDQRAVQSFSVDPGDEYAKYVKVEMISHYGKEHYCPLSILRVFGTSVEEEWDDHHNDNTDDDISGSPEEKPSSLFSNAKDTVLNLVKSVLTPEEEAKNNGTYANDSLPVNGSTKIDNQKNYETLEDDNQWKPLPPDVRSGETAEQPDNRGQALPDIPNVHIKRPVDVSKKTSQSGKGTKLGDLVHLIETPLEPLKYIRSNCLLCHRDINLTSKAVNNSICGYYTMMNNYGMMCGNDERRSQSYLKGLNKNKKRDENISEKVMEKETLKSQKKEGVHLESSHGYPGTMDDQVTATPVLDTEVDKSTIDTQPVFPEDNGEKITIAATSPPHSHTAQTAVPNFILVETKTGSTAEPSTVIQTPANSVITNGTTADSSSELDNIRQSTDKGDIEHKVNVDEDNKMGPDVVQLRPEPEKEAPEAAQEIKPCEPSQDATAEPAQKETGNGMKDIYPNTPHIESKDQEMDFAIPGEEQPGVRLSTRKETAYMRLNNRIKALELNLSLSSSYLEKLSQRYKRQMEDMYSSLNKTINKLTNMSKRAVERDSKQQDHIATLHRHIENLTVSMQEMYKSMSAMERQAIERHLCLMLIEAVVFILALSFCLRRNQEKFKNQRSSVTQVRGRSRSKAERSRHHSLEGSRPRSSSSICIGQGQNSLDEHASRHSGSETNLMIIKPLSPEKLISSSIDGKEWEPARRKKKKKSKVSGSASSANIQGLSGKPPACFSSAGLLFGARSSGADSRQNEKSAIQNGTATCSSQDLIYTSANNKSKLSDLQKSSVKYNTCINTNMNSNYIKGHKRSLCL